MSKDLARMADLLRAQLIGYGRKDRAGLECVATYKSWYMVAALELERRMVRIVESLPIDELEAITKRKINLNELARQALADLERE